MNKKKFVAVTALGAVIAMGGIRLRTVLADGIPAVNTLYYAGTLTASNQLVEGPGPITINLWAAGAPVAGETPLCRPTNTTTTFVHGRFRVALDAGCKDQIHAHPDAYVEVVYEGASLGRSKIGAVPFAVEAEHATSASVATGASGPLADDLTRLKAQSHPPSAFHAWLANGMTIPPSTITQVVFDHVEFDLGGEYDPATGVFKAAAAGIYTFTCGVEYRSPGPGGWSVAVYRASGDPQLGSTDVTSDGTAVRPEVTTVTELAAGDTVWCTSFQTTAAPQPLWLGVAKRNSFSGARLY